MMKDKYKKIIKNKTFLITGGTGSFGKTVTAELLKLGAKKIIILSRDEKKQFDMRNKFNNSKLKFVIGDVRDQNTLEDFMIGVDYVFHAAAMKQVPTCEFFPMEALKTNVIGTYNVLVSAAKNKVKKVVCLSTDKAVYPINVIGISKAMMEKVMIAESKKNKENSTIRTIFCAVRYGNVMYTRGSVLPYFVSLINKGKKISITDPSMTRFLLPLKEAVDLVFYALMHGQSGYIYVKKSPASTISTLANALTKVFNYDKGIEEVGIRAGEKVHETLITKEELTRALDKGDYFEIPPESQNLDYNKYLYKGKIFDTDKISPYTSENAKRLNEDKIIKLLLSLPEIREQLK